MTIQFIDVPLPVCSWYAEKADEMGMATLELMAHVLTLYPATVQRPRQPGAFKPRELPPVHVDDIAPIIPANSSRTVRLVYDARDDGLHNGAFS